LAQTPLQTVTVTLLDNCRTSTMSIADFTPYLAKQLWEVSTSDFQIASNDLSCGPIVHEIVGLEDPPFQLEAASDPSMLRIRTEATLLSQVGTYNYFIRVCLTFSFDGHQICARTSDLQIEIKNPCLETVPETKVMALLSVSQLDTNGILLMKWPFMDSTDLAIADAYGTRLCGAVQLEIFDAANNPVN